MFPALTSVPMLPTEDELARRTRRIAWWLHVARRVRGRTQEDVATYLSLKAGTSVGDFERGTTTPSLKQLALLAALYEVPLALFTDPPMSDEERLLDSATGAATLESEDWAVEQGKGRGVGGGPPGARRRAS